MNLPPTSLCGLVLLFGSAALFHQETPDPDGSEEILKILAETYKDQRTLEQIKKDNALIRAAASGDVEAARKALKNGALVNSRYLDGYARSVKRS